MRTFPVFLAPLVAVVLLAACDGIITRLVEHDETPPRLVSTQPAAGATNEYVNTQVVLRFDDPLRVTTVNPSNVYLVKRGTAGKVPASLVVPEPGVISLIPDAMLAADSVYDVMVGTGLRNAEGLALAAGMTYSFTTGTRTNTAVPVVTVTSHTNGQIVPGTFTLAGSAVITGSTITRVSMIGNDLASASNTAPYDQGMKTWTYNVAVGARDNVFANWTNELFVVAKAANGMATVARVRVAVDATPPALTIGNIANGSCVTRTNTVSGSASDAFGLTRIQWRTNDGVWVDAAGTVSWSAPLSTWEHPDDTQLQVEVRAVDRAGNVTTNTVVATVSNWAKTQLVSAALSTGVGFSSCIDGGIRLVFDTGGPKLVTGDGYDVDSTAYGWWVRYARHGGTDHVVYTRGENRLYYSKGTGSSFTVTTLDTKFNDETAGGCGLAVDSAGGVFVAYSEGEYSGAAVCCYLPPGTSTWKTNLLLNAAGPKNGFSVAVDAAGTNYALFYHQVSGELWQVSCYSAWWTGTSLAVSYYGGVSSAVPTSFPNGNPNLSATACFAGRLGFLYTTPASTGYQNLCLTIKEGAGTAGKVLVTSVPQSTLGGLALVGDATGQAYAAFRNGSVIHVARARYAGTPLIRRVATGCEGGSSLGVGLHLDTVDGSLVLVFMKPDKSVWAYRTTGF